MMIRKGFVGGERFIDADGKICRDVKRFCWFWTERANAFSRCNFCWKEKRINENEKKKIDELEQREFVDVHVRIDYSTESERNLCRVFRWNIDEPLRAKEMKSERNFCRIWIIKKTKSICPKKQYFYHSFIHSYPREITLCLIRRNFFFIDKM